MSRYPRKSKAVNSLVVKLGRHRILPAHHPVEQLLKAPQRVDHPRLHRRRQPATAFDRVVGPSAEVVEGQEHDAGGFQVLQLLGEARREPGEPLHQGPDREVVPGIRHHTDTRNVTGGASDRTAYGARHA